MKNGMKDTLKMAAKGQKICKLVGRTVRATSAYNGVLEGKVVRIEYNFYPVIELADGRTYRCDSTFEVV